ncbi:MAG: hypothetical protein ACRCW2_08260 [Cellulosilyticaceae bacterium]
MKKLQLCHLSHKRLCQLLVGLNCIPLTIGAILIGYYCSFVTKEVGILRTAAYAPTAVIEQQSLFLWVIISGSIFLWGFITLKILGECLCRMMSKV